MSTITVVSTAGFSSVGSIKIGDEIKTYTGITATDFTGCTRGGGAGADSHLDGVAVVQESVALENYLTRTEACKLVLV